MQHLRQFRNDEYLYKYKENYFWLCAVLHTCNAVSILIINPQETGMNISEVEK